MENSPSISISIAVLNEQRHIRHCLDSILAQTYDHGRISVRILDNGSADGTQGIIAGYLARMDGFHGAHFTQSTRNYGMWGGQEEMMKQGREPFLIFLSADVVMDERFVERAIAAMEKDPEAGALQAKVYQARIEDGRFLKSDTIDSCGFEVCRNRKVLNTGHGQIDGNRFETPREVFGVEGAVPVFRREALESIRILGEIADHDLFWYGEDLDVAWRLRLAGWKQIYEPSVVAWHERGTSKSHGHGWWGAYLPRVKERRKIPIRRRRLEWRNTRLTRVKNDYTINVLKDLPLIAWREIEVLGYAFLFEPAVLAEIPNFLRLLPKMLRKRKAIMKTAKATPQEIRSNFI